jgi:hypothetical protein
VRELLQIRDSSGAAGFVTTEKDQINLEGFAKQLAPLSVVKLSVTPERFEDLVERVVQLAAGQDSKAAKS